MPIIDPENLPLEAAQQILQQFVCLERSPNMPLPDNALVRQALRLVAEHSDYQIFGICADTGDQAIAALRGYLAELGYATMPTITASPDPVYLKFNPKTDRWHIAPYTGTHRGVLVSCQSAYDQGVNETFGHLPLNLFEEMT